MIRSVRLRIRGRVQGVGYRAWLAEEAERLGLGGWVRNRRDGSVEALVSGPAEAVDRLVELAGRGPRPAAVESIDRTVLDDPSGEGSFRILPTA